MKGRTGNRAGNYVARKTVPAKTVIGSIVVLPRTTYRAVSFKSQAHKVIDDDRIATVVVEFPSAIVFPGGSLNPDLYRGTRRE